MTEQIALDLESSGTFVADLPANPAQRVIDVWWAARAAGRRLHQCVDICSGTQQGANGQRVLITVQVRPATAEAHLPNPRGVVRRTGRGAPCSE